MRNVKMCGLLVAMLALAGPARATAVIDFEDWTGGSGQQDVVVSRGFEFHGGVLSVFSTPGSSNLTNALHVGAAGPKMLSSDLSPFDLVSLDLQEGVGNTVRVELIGHLTGPDWLSTTVTLDGDSTTFETFYLTGFSEVEMLFFNLYDAQGNYSSGLSIDNIVVPEPAAATLILLGMAVICRRRLGGF